MSEEEKVVSVNDMSPEMRRAFDALCRVAASSWPRRDERAEEIVMEVLEAQGAVIAAMRPIVDAVARFDETNEGDGAFECHWCAAVYDGVGDAETDHLPDCPVTQARALLAKES